MPAQLNKLKPEQIKQLRSARIKEVREEMGYTDDMEGFGKLFGGKKQNISGYERGIEPKSKFYIKLYLLRQYNPLYIMGVSEEKFIMPVPKDNLMLVRENQKLREKIFRLQSRLSKIKEDMYLREDELSDEFKKNLKKDLENLEDEEKDTFNLN